MNAMPIVGKQYIWDRADSGIQEPIVVTVDCLPDPNSLEYQARMCRVRLGRVTTWVKICELRAVSNSTA